MAPSMMPSGLSPRVRGNPQLTATAVPLPSTVYPRACGGTRSTPRGPKRSLALGSIPARAGEPAVPEGPGGSTVQVYPRACGGTKLTLKVGVSSPEPVYPRACGGTSATSVEIDRRAALGLSPRVRGNRVVRGLGESHSSGLSPRVRGNPSACRRRNSSAYARVYPRACGGTVASCPYGRGRRRPWVYPRACGGTP